MAQAHPASAPALPNGGEATVSALIGAEPAGEQPQLKNGSATGEQSQDKNESAAGEQSQDKNESALVSQLKELTVADADLPGHAASNPSVRLKVRSANAPQPRRAVSGAVNKRQYRALKKEQRAIKAAERSLVAARSQAALESFRAAGGQIESNTKEIEYSIQQFLDYTTPNEGAPTILAYFFSTVQRFAGNQEAGTGDSFTRPVACTVHVLPRIGSTAQNTFVVLAAVRGVVYTPGSDVSFQNVLLNQQNTIVKADYNVTWQKVLSWRESRLFSTTEIQPAFNGFAQELFRMQLIDPDTGLSFAGTFETVQVRITITVRQTVPQKNVVTSGIVYEADWQTTDGPALSDKFAMVQPRRLTNVT